jgi:hypothetical protein
MHLYCALPPLPPAKKQHYQGGIGDQTAVFSVSQKINLLTL